MTGDLFDEDAPAPPAATPSLPRARPRRVPVEPATAGTAVHELAASTPHRVHLGTSSWSFPGWKGLVWNGEHAESQLSKDGLAAYARHPLLRSVSLDRSFYRPLSSSQYAAYAAQVPDDFRFVVKAPSLVTDAQVRSSEGHGLQPNPAFLSPELAVSEFVQPVLDGLGGKAGALVFQISPLPASWLTRLPELFQRLGAMLSALPSRGTSTDTVVAVEVRDPQLLTPEFARVLRECRATYCVGLHAKMPPIEEQLPILRALWPGPLVCRWNLHRKHGAYGYEDAKDLYQPFDRLVDPDPETRQVLARVIAATTAAGFHAFVTINNKAEGSAPLSVLELATALHALTPDTTAEQACRAVAKPKT
ncbi:MAG: DUF72 domain-containing protein [Ramlibacter sp.]|nr:DUF72 domain-containing protein [Ramlibacter sp.]